MEFFNILMYLQNFENIESPEIQGLDVYPSNSCDFETLKLTLKFFETFDTYRNFKEPKSFITLKNFKRSKVRTQDSRFKIQDLPRPSKVSIIESCSRWLEFSMSRMNVWYDSKCFSAHRYLQYERTLSAWTCMVVCTHLQHRYVHWPRTALVTKVTQFCSFFFLLVFLAFCFDTLSDVQRTTD